MQAPQGKAALRSLLELREQDSGDAVTLYFGPDAPAGERRERWLQTVPGRGWFAYTRIYGPQRPAFDGQWRRGDIVAG